MNEHFKLPDGHMPFDSVSNKMSIDGNNNLYWEGRKLRTEVGLPKEVLTFGFWVGIAALAASFATCVQGYVAYDQWMSQQTTLEDTKINDGKK